MLKYLLIFFCVIGCSQVKAQSTANDPARDEFIDDMAKFAKKQSFVQEIPRFKGGAGDLYDYLQSHIIYPPEARKEQLSAQVFVSFLIDWKTGLPKEVKIVQSSNKIFEAETLRLIKAMPAWTPAKQNGTSVGMILTIPVYFHLD
ncbi:energy transducer TonB [Mucilaginibacter mali]|uniref:Energy transducer TonB n=1 Tax=Mucilaginibacter mali TaxID=2740462 RepID=A0A7D4UP57_9SPHI|nr:energy transducer TonB [Mucilaginibacter mali]QKJ29840.1 energy transducer TonB [Mucilaginibacter mali]